MKKDAEKSRAPVPRNRMVKGGQTRTRATTAEIIGVANLKPEISDPKK